MPGWDPARCGETRCVSMPVLLLSRSEVTKSLDPRALVSSLAEAFQIHSARRAKPSLPTRHFNFSAGSVSTSPVGALQGVPMYSVKVESRLPGRKPSISGVLQLYDSASGQLVAVLESSYITSLGSALTGALATDLLAAPKSRVIAVVGNGTQGWLGLRFLMEMRPLQEVNLFDLNRRKSCLLAERLKKYPHLKVQVCDSLSGAVSNADIICCSTWSNRPFLYSEMVKPGAHISSLGSDAKNKKELSSELLGACSFYCDDRDLAVTVGALQGVQGARELVVAELGEILSGRVNGRRSAEEITVYGAVGLPFVDLIAGWVTYRKALKKQFGLSFEALS